MLSNKHLLELYNKKLYIKAATLYQPRSKIYKLNNHLAKSGTININIYSLKCKSKFINHFFF